MIFDKIKEFWNTILKLLKIKNSDEIVFNDYENSTDNEKNNNNCLSEEKKEENIMNNIDFYDCVLVTDKTEGVSCFSKENEAMTGFFLPVGEDKTTLPDLISILYTVDDIPESGVNWENITSKDNSWTGISRRCTLGSLVMGKVKESTSESGQYWYMFTAYNNKWEIIANYRGVIDETDHGYPQLFSNMISFDIQDNWLPLDMKKSGYTLSLPVNVDGKVNFSAYLYFRF